MKLIRPILISVGVVGILGGITIGLALNPSIQRWALLRAAARHPDWHLKLDSISAGLSAVTANGVQFEHRDTKVSVDRIEAEYSPWAFLFGRRLQLGRVNALGVSVDAGQFSLQKSRSGIAIGPVLATGVLARIRLPWELTFGEVEVRGRVLLAGTAGQQPAIQGEFTLKGGQIAPGREGELRLKVRLKDSAPGARVTALDVQAALRLHESTDRTFDRAVFTSVLDASGPSLPGQNQLKLAVDMNRTLAGEKYRVTVDTVRAGQSENVLTFNATPSAQGKDGRSFYKGEWALSANSDQLESFMLGRALPKFAANGSGSFTFNPATTGIALQGVLAGEASEFEKLRPELRDIGRVRVKSDFAFEADQDVVRFKKSTVSLTGESPVLDLRAVDSLAFNLKQQRFESGSAVPGEILHLTLAGLPVAWVAPFCSAVNISGASVTGAVSILQGPDGELSVQTTTPLQTDGVTVVRAGRTLLAKAALKVDATADFSPLSTRIKIRSLSLKSAAGDSVEAKLLLTAPLGFRPPVSVEGDFSADLPALLIPLLPAGPLKARGAVDFTWQDDRVEVRRLAVESSDANGNVLGSLAVTHAFYWDLANGRAETGVPDEVVLANIKFGQLPLLALPKAFAGFSASGRLGPAEATLAAIGGKLILRATTPVSILDFSISRQKKPVLDRLKLVLQPVVEFEDGIFARVRTGAITVRTGADVPLAELNGEFANNDSGLRLAGTFGLDLPAWSSQPALLGRDALSSGQAKGEVRAVLAGNAAQVEARATINGLIANESGQTLPVANLSLRADIDSAGHVSLQIPVLFDRAGQRSDIGFSAEGNFAPKGISFDAKLKSEHIELRDMLMLLAVVGSPLADEGPDSASVQSRAISPPSADPAAFWSGMTGQVTLDCKAVVGGPEWAMTGLTGHLAVTDDKLVLEKVAATFDESSRFTAQGALTFSPDLNPYHLTGNFSLSEFDVGRYFKTIDPDSAPMLEGIFAIKGELQARGLNFDDTIDRAQGVYDFTSRQGIFRGLKRPTDKVSMASKAVVLVSSLLGDKSAEKLTGNAYYIEQLAQELEEIRFDQFTARLLRDPALNLRLENITLISEQIHCLGSGQVTYVAGKPLQQQPLETTLSLHGRGKIEEMLGKLKVLDGTRDELGYAKAKDPLALGGTLGKPDPTPFFARLAASKPNDSPSPEK